MTCREHRLSSYFPRLVKKSFLLPVLVVCFSPVTLFLLIGSLVLLPMQIYLISGSGALHWERPVGLIAMISGGVVGLVTLISLAIRVLSEREVDRPYLIIAGAIVGIVSVMPSVSVAEPTPLIALGLLPVFGSAYILVAGRHLLVPLVRPSVRPVIPVYVWALAAIVAIVAIALGTFIYPRGNLSHDDLLAKKELWLQNRPVSYSYDLNTCGKDYQPPRHITVDGDRVVFAEYLVLRARKNLGAQYPPAQTTSSTMTAIFDELIEARARGNQVRALFDGRLGFVEKAAVEAPGGHNDCEVTVLNFEPRGEGRKAIKGLRVTE